MFYQLIQHKRDEWYASPACTVVDMIAYIVRRGMMRDAQIEAIKTYLYLKIACGNRPLWKLYHDGAFNTLDTAQMPLTGDARNAVENNPAAAALLEYALLKDRKGKPIAPQLVEHINEHVEELQFERIFRDIFYGVDYTDYLFSLPMGAGKTYLMAAFTHLEIKDGVSLFRNPQQTNDKLMELTGVSGISQWGDFWSGTFTDSKLGTVPVHLPNFLPGKRPMVDEALLNLLVHEKLAAVPDGTKKVVIYYIDSIDDDKRDEFLRQHNIYVETEIEFRDLKPVLDNVVAEDEIDFTLAEVSIDGGMFPVWQLTINRFTSDRVLRNIHEENEKRYQQYLKKNEKKNIADGSSAPKFLRINVSDEGLETIEWLSLDCQCADKSAPWHSDVEVKIDKAGNAIRNGKPTGRFWDGTISTDDNTLKPLRLKVRNICGDETVVVLDESL